MITSFLLIVLVEVICTSKTVNTVGRKRNLNQDQEKLDWALDQLPHHRTKRFLFLTEEKRLVMPPGSQLVLTPTLALPFLRYPPTGLDANMTISTPFTLNFDKMGLTDNANPIGLLPYIQP